ncbi:MAG: Serine hydroxymethyltransferase [Microgenomates bacterium OLB23]|nr:MAG: Serine hydroxymethyltransferase [Microgenomates bacterium OLB23]
MKDTQIYDLVKKETQRQTRGIELIASENYASRHVRAVLSSVLTNKYSEGYPKARYYGGNEVIDEVEIIAQERAKKLFGVPFANVQPYSGSPANFSVYVATCKPGDTIMGQELTAGGHLTHGYKVSATALFFNSVQYGVRSKPGGKHNDLFDYAAIRALAKKVKPKLIWVGATTYPLAFHYEEFAKIADEVGAYLAADIAHVAGLIAGGAHPSPVPYAHIVTTTTHKTLRGPRGAIVMVTEKGLKKDPDLPAKINKAIFPGLQGGPHDNQTAAIAVALFEALQPSFKTYAKKVIKNAQALAAELQKGGLNLVAGRTENHQVVVDLTSTHGPGAGIFAEKALDLVYLTLNKNSVPGEQSSPFYPSGVRIGTPVATTRGMGPAEMKKIGAIIVAVFELIKPYKLPQKLSERSAYIDAFVKDLAQNKDIKRMGKQVAALGRQFPLV